MQICLEFYKNAMRAMRKYMLTELWMGEDTGSIWIAADVDGWAPNLRKTLILEHLTCFLPGTMALGEAPEAEGAKGPGGGRSRERRACGSALHACGLPSGLER